MKVGRPKMKKADKRAKISVTLSKEAHDCLDKNTNNKSALIEKLILDKFSNNG